MGPESRKSGQEKQRQTNIKNRINIWTTNADVLTNEKILELKTRLQEEQPHIIAITEVRPKNWKHEISLAQYKLPGYNMEGINLDEDVGRGMLIYIKDTMRYNMLDLQNIVFNEAIACEIQLQGKNTLIFCSVYRSPNSTEENDIGLHNLLYTLSTQAQGNLVITGDFNYPNIDWDLYRNLNDTMDKEFRFLEIVKDCFLFQHVNKPTRGRGTNIPSILDLVLTDEENLLDTLEHWNMKHH